MKKFLSLALVIAMVFSTFTVTFAAAGTEEDPVLISSLAELVAAANEINTNGSEGKYYKLGADIDLKGEVWSTYIGTEAVPFSGTFDGNGHIIKNVKYDVPGYDNSGNARVGIFGVVGGNAVIKNLGVDTVNVVATATWGWNAIVGGIAAKLTGNAKVDTCYVKDMVVNVKETEGKSFGLSSSGSIAGVVDSADVVVTNCYSMGFLELNGSIATEDGLIGQVINIGELSNCYSDTTLACVATTFIEKVTNSYCVTKATWVPANYTRAGEQKTAAELKDMAGTLGSAYKTGPSYNNGFPVFTWQPDAEGMSGTGAQDDPYVIETKEHLIEASLVTESAGKYFELANDIDLENKVWSTFIGTETASFKGIFDGKGHIIRNVKFDVPGYDNSGNARVGIFGVVGGDAVIKNLGIDTINVGATATWGWNAIVGGLAAKLTDNAKVDSCYVKDMVVNTKDATGKTLQPATAGSIAGFVDGTGVVITNCIALGFKELNSSISTEDGLVGQAANFSEISNCYSDTTLACVTTACSEKVINSYGLSKLSWAPDNYSRAGEVVTVGQLKAKTADLGGAFKKGGLETKGFPALSWMNVSEITIAEGSGTYDEPYIVKTADDLAAIADFTETAGVYFELANDIDMGGALWETYIGSEAAPFKGVFNGNGHVIKNYTFSVSDAQPVVGLFGYTGGNAHIFSVGVEDITATLAAKFQWNAKFGGLVGYVGGNTAITECYAKNVNFEAGWEITAKQQGQFNTAGGLFGWAEGTGVEIRQCYALGIDTGLKQFINGEGQEQTYALIMYDGGLGGRAQLVKAIDYCYSDTYVVQYDLANQHRVTNCYFQVPHTEWYKNSGWAGWQTDVKYLSNLWSVKFLPQASEIDSPVLKWEKGGYLNLIPAGSMNIDESVFGAGTTVIDGNNKGRASKVLSVNADASVKAPVTLEEGKYYRVSFRGRTNSGDEADYTMTLGTADMNSAISDKTLGKDWETKVAFVKAEVTETVDFVIDSESAILVDDVEIIEINPDYESAAVNEAIRLEYFKVDSLQADMYVLSHAADGVEIKYETENGYIDSKGRLQNRPVGFGTVNDTFKAYVDIADVHIEKSIDIVIEMIQPVDVKGVNLVDDEGNTVYDIDFAEKVSNIEIVNNNNEENLSVMVALYDGGKLTTVKTVAVDETGSYPVDMAVNGADKVKLFAVRNDGSLEPLAFTEESYDTLDTTDKVELHTIGDSIVTDYAEGQTLNGWGQRIDEYFDENYLVVDNSLSRGGMTAEEFLKEPVRWATMLPKLDKNDYVFISLSHNDSGVYDVETFKNLLTQFIDGAREKGAIPVLITAPEMITCVSDTKGEDGKYIINAKLTNYTAGMIELAEEKSVPLIDLNAWSHELQAKYGYTELYAKGLWSGDFLHFLPKGAKAIAGFITNKVQELKLPIADFILEDELPAIEDLVK